MLPLNDKKVVQENVLLNCKYPMGFRLGKSNEKSPTQQMQPWRNRNFLSTPPKQLVEIHTYISWYSSCVKIDSNALGLHRWTSSKKRRSHGPWPTNGPLVGFPEYAHQADSHRRCWVADVTFSEKLGRTVSPPWYANRRRSQGSSGRSSRHFFMMPWQTSGCLPVLLVPLVHYAGRLVEKHHSNSTRWYKTDKDNQQGPNPTTLRISVVIGPYLVGSIVANQMTTHM